MTEWNARRILKELTAGDRRRAILADFWRHADADNRRQALAYLAKTLHFRDASLAKMPPDKKAELLASRLGNPECEHYFAMALMEYHIHRQKPLMAAFLDSWEIPHEDGAIAEEAGEKGPTAEQVRAAVAQHATAFDRADVRLYLASAGLLMGPEWRDAMWPVVDEMGGEPAAK